MDKQANLNPENKKMISILTHNNKSVNTEKIYKNEENPHGKLDKGTTSSMMKDSSLMNFTQMLESMDEISDSIDQTSGDLSTEMDNLPIDDSKPLMGIGSGVNEDEILDELNKIFTPILIMQGFEGNISDQIQEAFSEANVLVERNVIKFDDSTRMAQLISVCSLLIAKQKQSSQWMMYKKASDIRNKMKLEIQKAEYSMAQSIAQKFLVKVSTTNNSSVARQYANDLLPETQH